MKFYDEDFAQSFAPKCDIFGMIGTIAGIAGNASNVDKTNAANIEMTEATNAANLAIAESTNKTNKQIADEANAAAQAQADIAYERSTASNQIAELVKAGYSPQQARTIVAGTGAAATYTAAPVQAATAEGATMQAPQAQAAQMDASALGHAMSGLGSQLTSDLQSPDGGAIGQLLYNDISNDLRELDGYDPTDFYSIEQFRHHALEKDENGEYKRKDWADFVNSDKFKKCSRSILGKRAFNNAHSEFVAARNNAIQMYRGEINWDMEKIEKELKDMSLTMQRLFQQPQIDLSLKKFDLELSTLEFRPEYNQKYLQKKIERLCADEDGQLIMAEILQMKNKDYRDQYKKLGATRNFVTMMHILGETGMTSTEAGVAIASLQALGVPIAPALQSAVNALFPTDNNGNFSPQKFSNGFKAGYREFQDIVSYPVRAGYGLITQHHLPPLWQPWEEYSNIGIHQGDEKK